MIELKAISEKQQTYAMNVRADALNSLEQFRSIFISSTTFFGTNLFSIYNAAKELILSLEDAAAVLDHAAAIANEAKAFAAKWEQHYNYCKQHGKKPYSAQFILANADPSATGCRYLTADMLSKQ